MIQIIRVDSMLACALAALVLAVAGGCSSDSNPTGSGGGGGGGTNPAGVPLSTAAATIPGPIQTAASASPTSGAALAAYYFDQYNSIDRYGSWLTGVPSAARQGASATPADTTTYTSDSLEITVVINSTINEPDTVVEWKVILNGSDSLNSYSDFEFITGLYNHYHGPTRAAAFNGGEQGAVPHQSIAAAAFAGGGDLYGNMQINDRATGNLSSESWSWSDDPIFTDFYGYTFPGGFVNIFVESLDGSGYLEVFLFGAPGAAPAGGEVPNYRADWSSSGNGSWFASTDGISTDSTGVF